MHDSINYLQMNSTFWPPLGEYIQLIFFSGAPKQFSGNKSGIVAIPLVYRIVHRNLYNSMHSFAVLKCSTLFEFSIFSSSMEFRSMYICWLYHLLQFLAQQCQAEFDDKYTKNVNKTNSYQNRCGTKGMSIRCLLYSKLNHAFHW